MTDEKERESADLIHPTAIIDPRADIGKGVNSSFQDLPEYVGNHCHDVVANSV